MSVFHRHTHCGCDQRFSRISIKLRKEDALTLDDLKRVIVDSWHSSDGQSPEVHDLTMVADVKSWLSEALDNRLHHHTTAHQFLFEHKEYHGEMRAVMSCKLFSVNPDWFLVGPVLKVSTPMVTHSGTSDFKRTLFHSCRQILTGVNSSQGHPVGCPTGAAARNLFHQHVPRIPKGNLSAEQYERAQSQETARIGRLMDER